METKVFVLELQYRYEASLEHPEITVWKIEAVYDSPGAVLKAIEALKQENPPNVTAYRFQALPLKDKP